MIAEPIVRESEDDVVAEAEAVLVAAVFDQIVSDLRCAVDAVDRPDGPTPQAVAPRSASRWATRPPRAPGRVAIRSPPRARR